MFSITLKQIPECNQYSWWNSISNPITCSYFWSTVRQLVLFESWTAVEMVVTISMNKYMDMGSGPHSCPRRWANKSSFINCLSFFAFCLQTPTFTQLRSCGWCKRIRPHNPICMKWNKNGNTVSQRWMNGVSCLCIYDSQIPHIWKYDSGRQTMLFIPNVCIHLIYCMGIVWHSTMLQSGVNEFINLVVFG